MYTTFQLSTPRKKESSVWGTCSSSSWCLFLSVAVLAHGKNRHATNLHFHDFHLVQKKRKCKIYFHEQSPNPPMWIPEQRLSRGWTSFPCQEQSFRASPPSIQLSLISVTSSSLLLPSGRVEILFFLPPIIHHCLLQERVWTPLYQNSSVCCLVGSSFRLFCR